MSRTTARFFARWFDRDAFAEESKTTRLMDGRKRKKGPEDAATVRMPGRRRPPRRPLVATVEADTALDVPLPRPFLVDPASEETVLRADSAPRPTVKNAMGPPSGPAPLVLPDGAHGRSPSIDTQAPKGGRQRWTAWSVIPIGVVLGLLAGGLLSSLILVLARLLLA
ncbi:MAG: hypothetical protein KTR31_34615 [Myxococcales bacterium]|nr:hypothetical protein [Myxococcales bacterium]